MNNLNELAVVDPVSLINALLPLVTAILGAIFGKKREQRKTAKKQAEDDAAAQRRTRG